MQPEHESVSDHDPDQDVEGFAPDVQRLSDVKEDEVHLPESLVFMVSVRAHGCGYAQEGLQAQLLDCCSEL